jgi:broad specificity phosphatase PhoE
LTEVYLVRHGQTDWNVDGRYQGWADIPLNNTGFDQAHALASVLKRQTYVALYSSDLSRARQTAEVIGQYVGLPVQIDQRLREIDQGEWEGQRVAEVKLRYHAVIETGEKDPVNTPAPGGESVAQVAARAAQALNEITAHHPTGPVLAVMHGLILATLVCQARGIPLHDVYDYIPNNAHSEIISWPPV